MLTWVTLRFRWLLFPRWVHLHFTLPWKLPWGRERVRTLTVVFDQVPLFLSLALNESLVFCNHSIREISFLYLILLSVKYVLSLGEKAPGMYRVKSWWVPCVVTYRVSDKKKNWSSFEAQTPCHIRKRVTGQWLQEDRRLLPLPRTPGRSCRFSGLTFTHIFLLSSCLSVGLCCIPGPQGR